MAVSDTKKDQLDAAPRLWQRLWICSCRPLRGRVAFGARLDCTSRQAASIRTSWMLLPACGSGCGQKADSILRYSQAVPDPSASTLRYSQAVPDPSANRALSRLTSEVKKDPVHSTRYGRQRQLDGQADMQRNLKL